MNSTLIAGLIVSFTLPAANSSAAGELYEYPGAYRQQNGPVIPRGRPSATGTQFSQAKPKLRFHQPFTSIVMQDPAPHSPNVNSPKTDAGKGALATGSQATPAAKATAKGGTPHEASHSIQQESGPSASGGSMQPYIAGPLWNSRSGTKAK